MMTLAIAAVMATLLGALGLYGLLSYTVGLERHEIGLRMALGARADQVVGRVVGRGFALAGAGVSIGLLVAAVASRALRGLLYETPRLDPILFVVVSALTIAVAIVASYLPARRASAVSPLESMRSE